MDSEEKIISLKEKYKKIFNDIEKTEKSVKLQLDKIFIKRIKENTIKLHYKESSKGFKVRMDMISNSVKKLNYFIADEDICLESLNELFKEFCYDTSNSIILENIEFDIINKYKIINQNRKNNITVLNYVVEKYNDTKQEVINDIGDGLSG